MKKYVYESVDAGGFIDHVFKNHREIIDSYAEKGYRYAGYIPTRTTSSGGLLTIDLIFEIEE